MLIDASADVLIPIVSADPSTDAAVDADSAPTFRIYSETGAIADGTCDVLDSGTITNVTAATPPVVTDVDHGLATGQTIDVAGVGGTTGVNGVHTVTVIDADHFSLDGATGTGAYTSGGTWHVPGLYSATLDSSIRSALDPGKSYTLVVYGIFSSVKRIVERIRFTVVS